MNHFRVRVDVDLDADTVAEMLAWFLWAGPDETPSLRTAEDCRRALRIAIQNAAARHDFGPPEEYREAVREIVRQHMRTKR